MDFILDFYLDTYNFLLSLPFCFDLFGMVNFCKFIFPNTTVFFGGFYNFLENLENLFFTFLILLLFDFLFYIFGILFGGIFFFKKLIYNNKNLFYIYFRFIPILGNFGTFIGAFLSSEIDFKQDLKKIFLGNLFFLIFIFIFWKINLYVWSFL